MLRDNVKPAFEVMLDKLCRKLIRFSYGLETGVVGGLV